MGKKTSVDLTDAVLPLKEKYQPVYGLKNILSAGVLLFDRIPQHLRERIIRIANGVDDDAGDIFDPEEVSDAMDAAFVQYRLLSPAESESLDRLRDLLGPDETEKVLKDTVAIVEGVDGAAAVSKAAKQKRRQRDRSKRA